MENSEADIEHILVGLLARREHSQQELRRKLAQRGFREQAVAPVLQRLAQHRLQSDARFAECYARQRQEKGYGPVRIGYELQERGVETAHIEAALAELEVDWWHRAREVRAKRFGLTAPADFKAKARQLRYLQNRGFTSEQCQAALRDE